MPYVACRQWEFHLSFFLFFVCDHMSHASNHRERKNGVKKKPSKKSVQLKHLLWHLQLRRYFTLHISWLRVSFEQKTPQSLFVLIEFFLRTNQLDSIISHLPFQSSVFRQFSSQLMPYIHIFHYQFFPSSFVSAQFFPLNSNQNQIIQHALEDSRPWERKI